MNHFTRYRIRQQIGAYRPRLYRVAFAWCGDHHRAEDLVQETMSKSLARLHQLKDAEHLKPWLFSILNNCLKDQYRSPAARETELHTEMLEPSASAEQSAEIDERIRQVRNAISGLSLAQREVLILIDLEGFSYAETAEVLQLPVGTIMSRLSRAREKLKDKLIRHRSPNETASPFMRRVK